MVFTKGILSLILIILAVMLGPVMGYGQGQWGWWKQLSKSPQQFNLPLLSTDWNQPFLSNIQPRDLLSSSFPRPRYQFPSSVTQPVNPGAVKTPAPSRAINRQGPELRGRPTSRYSPTSTSQDPFSSTPILSGSNRWSGWSSSFSSSPQNENPSIPPSQPSLNDPLNPYRHDVTLDPQGCYQLVWVYDWTRNLTIFNVTARTTGWIGFGLARRLSGNSGKMSGADIFIGGVHPNGSFYFSDRYAIGNQLPLIDPSQDWDLHDAWERDGQTFLSFSRPIDTCDPDHDVPITDDSLRLLWSFGETDELISHFENRGVGDAYLLTPDLTPLEVISKDVEMSPETSNLRSSLLSFNHTVTLPLPGRDTTYWCTWVRVPTTTKHHIIGYDALFPTEKDRRHIHHLVSHRCTAPPGINPDSLFGPASRSQGAECYFEDEFNPQPYRYCREPTQVWGVGGLPFFLPEHVGIPMSETGPEYYMVQVHYDNPQRISNLDITFTWRTFYTNNLREHDGAMLGLGQQFPAAMSIVIPPLSTDHASIGLCPGSCTEQGLQGQEVNIVAGWLHTHINGAATRTQILRGNKELPWLEHDENWNFNFQQFRMFHRERRLMPGDVLVHRCEYDTTAVNGTAVGGFGTHEAMCSSNFYYYPRQLGFAYCRSITRDERYWDLLKVRNATWDTERRQTVITDPPQFAGLTMLEHVNQNLEWNEGYRREVQRQQLTAPQVAQCPDSLLAPQVSLRELEGFAVRGSFPPLPPQPNGEHPVRSPINALRYRLPQQCNA